MKCCETCVYRLMKKNNKHARDHRVHKEAIKARTHISCHERKAVCAGFRAEYKAGKVESDTLQVMERLNIL